MNWTACYVRTRSERLNNNGDGNNIKAVRMIGLRAALTLLGVIGTLVFGTAFLTSYLNPGFVEQTAKRIIRYEVEKQVREKVESLDTAFLTKKAGRLLQGYADEITGAKQQLAAGLPQRLATVIAEMQNLDCECRKKIESSISDGLKWQIGVASLASDRLNTMIRTKYMETAGKLTREFRIFTATNALVFALLALAAVVKKRAGFHLVLPAIVLLIAAGLTAWLYLFNQNWLHTLVFNDYVGFAYIGYLGIVFAFLSDILFNHARITTVLVNRLLDVLGSSASLMPC